ncbi:MAG: cupin domain-containing protein [Deltaproteobacteria bacterium]|nr:cupin domain-containing protein [Deltaproteobacteria bacterium]MBI3387151.1 cupin domain-containing protein [Deltaproteobacteria bacterium]
MSTFILRRSSWLGLLAVGVVGCAQHRPPQVVLPGLPTNLSELATRYPLAPGQPVRAERLGATAHVSYHFVQLAPGAGERPHLHAQHDLIATILHGRGTQWIGEQSIEMRAGDSATIPAGTPHSFVNTGDCPSAALVIFSPPYDGSDQVFLDVK